ncbi:MAG: phytoene desaturase family protein [Salinispira sp.]
MEMKTVLVIGGGFTGMAVAALLQNKGMDVSIAEKNSHLGGRARTWSSKGYTFDMGPSWYLMPEVFEKFFTSLGKKRENYYTLQKLDPLYRVFFEGENTVDIHSDIEQTAKLFESFERGGQARLKAYLEDCRYKYQLALNRFLYSEYRNIFQFFNPSTVFHGLRLGIFGSLHKHVQKYFSDHRAQKILEYAMVFLGTSPNAAPSFYSIMSHVDLVQGVYFPQGGMGAMVAGMEKLLSELNVTVRTNCEVQHIHAEGKKVESVQTSQGIMKPDYVIGTGDYHHLEQDLLEKPYRNLSKRYWQKAVLAPSMFILYLGVRRKIPQLAHHNLFFASDWNRHFNQIFEKPQWPDNPSYYVSAVSRDDDTMAPPGRENIFILVPIAPGLECTEEHKQRYAEKMIIHLEALTGKSIRDEIEVQRIYTAQDFQDDYHAFKGTALGLAHTLGQTAVFRPSMRNRKLENLFYAGQYTHPGVGVPMTFIAADIVADILAETVKTAGTA